MKKRTNYILKTIFFVCFLTIVSSATTIVKAQTGWVHDAEGSYYLIDDDTRAKNWYQIQEKWYYFGNDGIMKTGWQEVSGKLHYLGTDGTMLTGWQKIEENWYYLDNNGCLVNDNSAEKDTIKGIDVSKWQGDIDWSQVKNAGIEFTFIRIGHGSRTLDTKYIANMQGAIEEEIPVGVYFYSTAKTEDDAVLDAQFVIQNLQGYLVSYPVVLDLEDASQLELGKDKITDIAIAFCNEIRAAGYTPMIYCNEYWYTNYIDFNRLDGIERWIAKYNVKPSPSIERGIWQCGNTGRIPGINGNVDINFGNIDYTTIVTARDSAISSYFNTAGVWKEDSVGKWYQYMTGGYPSNKWEKLDGQWYWFNSAGYMTTGWVKNGDNWYYMNPDGTMATGWVKVSDNWYYMNSDGTMVTGWLKIGNNWYYMNPDGTMVTGWAKISDNWYYMKPDGTMATGWIKISGTWYFMNPYGTMATGWVNDGGTWYYMKSTGAMATGWIQVNGTWYYLYSYGAMAKNTWIGSCYVNADGAWIG